jgi:hypothetical protein
MHAMILVYKSQIMASDPGNPAQASCIFLRFFNICELLVKKIKHIKIL